METSELLIFMNKSMNKSSACDSSQPLINMDRYENDDLLVGANITVSNNLLSSSTSFSSLELTRGSMLGDESNDEEFTINRQSLKDIFINILGKLESLEEQLEMIKHKTSKLNNLYKNDLDDVYDKFYDIECRVIQNEQYSRRENIIISGIPDNVNQKDLEKSVLNILNSIGMKISSYEIAACHRLRKNRFDKFPAKTIVRFTNRQIVDYCLRHRNRLSDVKVTTFLGMNLRFYESLCFDNEQILKECYKLKKDGLLNNYLIRNGFVKIIKNEGDKPFKIIHPEILYDMFNI